MVVDAQGPGVTAMALINDYRGSGSLRWANAQLVKCLVRGVPRLVVLSLVVIQPGAEILMDYGEEFWET